MPENILITGPTNGIGRETALSLAGRGYRLILLCRNREAGQALCQQIVSMAAPEPLLLVADLGDMAQVRAAADSFLARGEPLHVLINNAGVINTERRLVAVGDTRQEQMFTVNYLGHYLLTRLLLPCLEQTARQSGKAARIVVVASEAHALFCKGIDFDDLDYAQRFKSFLAYGRSKLANILMVRSLVKRVNAGEVQVNSLHPGAVRSNLGVSNNEHWYTGLVQALLYPFFISAEKGAKTSVFLATGPIATQGEYYYRCKPHRLKPWARDDAAAERLWTFSESLLQPWLAPAVLS